MVEFESPYDDLTKEEVEEIINQNVGQAKSDEPGAFQKYVQDPIAGMKSSGLYNAIPAELPEKGFNVVRDAARKGGEFVKQQIPRMFPDQVGAKAIGAGSGAALKYGPDVAAMGEAPVEVTKGLFGPAVGSARRALGYPARMLNTPFARRQATAAAGRAVEENIIPASGSITGTSRNIENALRETGRRIGEIRASVGRQSPEAIQNRLEALRSEMTAGGARGGAWDEVHAAIDKAKATVSGLAEQDLARRYPGFNRSHGERPRFEVIEQSSKEGLGQRPRFAAMKSGQSEIDPATGFIPEQESSYRFSGSSRVGVPQGDLATGITVEQPASYRFSGSSKVGPIANPDQMLGVSRIPEGQVILNEVGKIKSGISDRLNYLSDRATQAQAKQMVNSIEMGIKDILARGGADVNTYNALSKYYSQLKSMETAVNAEIAKQMGNKPVSLLSVIPAAGQLGAGSPAAAAGTLGLGELAMRRGSGITSRALQGAYRQAPRAGAAAGYGGYRAIEPIFRDRNQR
jgi:hypothetical protein